MYAMNVLEAIGRTPLVRLNSVTRGLKATICAKLEYMNPGGSVKDRIGIAMIEDAERRGLLKPGGTLIEGTSGNTGVGLALAAVVKGYRMIFTITDKQSREKIDLLKAFGAEVIVCPTAVPPDDPRSYYSVARKLSREIPNSFYPNQYYNPNNPRAHYETTGPELWEQTEGKITHFVCGVGTGGTITGVAKYLKEKNPKVKIVGADPVGSLFYDFFHTGKIVEAHTYKVEGIGEDIFPSTLDFSLLDDIIQVSDKDIFLAARRLVKEEGLLSGGSAGAPMHAALRLAEGLDEKGLVVILLPDSGVKYLRKVYNDEWMRENQFFDPVVRLTGADLIREKPGGFRELITVAPNETAQAALALMQEREISQVPVFEEQTPVGTLHEDGVIDLLVMGKNLREISVREVMGPSLPVLPRTAGLDQIASTVTRGASAVLVDAGNGTFGILTKYDILHLMAKQGGG